MTNDLSPFFGVTRRDFLKYCGWLAATIGVQGIGALDVALALEEAALGQRPKVIYSSFQECTGCAIQLLQAREPHIATVILRTISLDYQENVMAAAGDAAEKVYNDAVEAGDFYWVVEGSIPTTIPEAIMIGGRTAADICRETYPKATATIAYGSCATYGNIQAADPNPTGAKGIAQFLREDGGVENPVVINMSRCPGNADDLLLALTYVLTTGKVPELDSIGRPLLLYGSTIHDNCYRRGHFDAGEFVEFFGDPNEANDWCLYKVGCKGPFTYAPCGARKWNGNISWCVQAGTCQGCAEPDFWDKLTPFYEQTRDIGPNGIGEVTAEQIGIGLGIATAVGLGAHAVAQGVSGRFGHGGPPEDETTEGGRR